MSNTKNTSKDNKIINRPFEDLLKNVKKEKKEKGK